MANYNPTFFQDLVKSERPKKYGRNSRGFNETGEIDSFNIITNNRFSVFSEDYVSDHDSDTDNSCDSKPVKSDNIILISKPDNKKSILKLLSLKKFKFRYEFEGNNLRIIPENINEENKISLFLAENSYNYKVAKDSLTVVIKGLPIDFPIDELKTILELKNFEIINITPLKVKSKKNTIHFIIELPINENSNEILKLTYLYNFEITVECYRDFTEKTFSQSYTTSSPAATKSYNSFPYIMAFNPDNTVELMKKLMSQNFVFTIKIENEFHRINPNDIDEKTKIVDFLEKNSIQYILKEAPNLKVIIEGLPIDFPSDKLKEILESKNFEIIGITQTKLSTFKIELPRNSSSNEIYKLTSVGEHEISIERPHRYQSSIQCFRCQLFDHHTDECHMKPKCFKCTGEHMSDDCTRTDTESDLFIKRCVNCKGIGHLANNSKLCPKFPRVKKSNFKSKRSDLLK